MGYQDELGEDGEVISKGYRDCEERYEAIAHEVAALRRPFTVLDLGAAEGYFALRLTRDFGARVVAVDSRQVVRAVEGKVAAVRVADVDADAVHKLGSFDVVLALSFLHHVPDWRRMLERLDRSFRSRLFIEVPHPGERLRDALNRNALPVIDAAVRARGVRRIADTPAVWDRDLTRGLYVKERAGLPVVGEVFGGSGNNGRHVPRFVHELEPVLGYRPFPGSLNLRTRWAFRLGPYAGEFVDESRGRGGRRGGDYQLWPARVDGYDGPVHVIRPGERGHGRYSLELWAPDKLRDVLKLKDGDTVTVRVGA